MPEEQPSNADRRLQVGFAEGGNAVEERWYPLRPTVSLRDGRSTPAWNRNTRTDKGKKEEFMSVSRLSCLFSGFLFLVAAVAVHPDQASAQNPSYCDGYARDFAQRNLTGYVARGTTRGVIGGGRLHKCLSTNRDKLEQKCQTVLSQAEKDLQ